MFTMWKLFRFLKKNPDRMIVVARHQPELTGFYATIHENNDSLSLGSRNSWGEAGHGRTVRSAIDEALRIHSGALKASEYTTVDFKSRGGS